MSAQPSGASEVQRDFGIGGLLSQGDGGDGQLDRLHTHLMFHLAAAQKLAAAFDFQGARPFLDLGPIRPGLRGFTPSLGVI